jgi:hypothetical protein
MDKHIPWGIHPLESKHPDELLEIPQDDEGYYLDSEGNRIAFNGNRELKPAYVRLALNQYHIDEIRKCSEDLKYFIFNYCKVLTKTGWRIPDLRDYQEEYILNMLTHNRLILNSPRQSGKTVTSALKFIWSLNFVQDTSIGICANIEKGANEVLHKMKQSFNKLPIWLQQGVTKWNVKSIYFENGSKCITSATNGDAFRGFSFVGGIDKNGNGHSTLYMDEVAFVDNWHSFADSVLPTVSSDPNANIIMTSTPNGMNHYYEMVKDARLMKSEYSVQEVRWNCLSERNEEWREKIIKTHGLVYFSQNFGGKFLGSSATLLNANTLEKLESREPIEHTDSFSVYQKPHKDGKYILLCDLASGTGGDYTVVQVIKILKNKFEQVAVFRSNTTPLLSMTSIIHSIAMKYNEAYVLFEINYGSEVASRLYYDIEYENLLTIALVNSVQTLLGFKGQFRLGLQVDTKIKASELISLKALIESNKLVVNDNDTISELYNFIQKGTSFEADLGKHDDCVMSLALLGWLVNQESFKEIVNYDFISDYEVIKAEEVSDLLPANMFGTGSYAHDNDTSWLTT